MYAYAWGPAYCVASMRIMKQHANRAARFGALRQCALAPNLRMRQRASAGVRIDRVGSIYRGSTDDPIRNSSTARAAWRPSRIAHTTSDCPRRMSPAAKTFGADVL